LMTAVAVLLVASFGFGQNYFIPWSSVNSGGSPGTSTGYGSNGSAGQAVQGTGTSVGYEGYWGFWYGVGRPVKLNVGVTQIVAPVGRVDTHDIVVPKATWHNYSAEEEATFTAYFILVDPTSGRPYTEDSLVTALAPGGTFTCEFPSFDVGATEGDWTARCSTFCAQDTFATDDTREGTFVVSAAPPWTEGWVEVTSVPSSPTPKQVKDGGWLTVATPVTDAGEAYVYAAKGNKTGDFYRYNPFEGDSGRWYVLESIPSDEGGRAKLPKKGCVGVSDGQDYIYMTKGNNTLGFWKYAIAGDSWARLPDVPLGPNNKKVKGGGDLAYVSGVTDEESSYVYLMKGYKTEFYRFNVASNRWDTLYNVPYGVAPKYNAGSFLVYDGSGYLYAHQSKYTDALKTKHFMFRYDLAAQAWADTVNGMPVPGKDGGKIKNKKSKDGGSGAWFGGKLYALKGGNTVQFYCYEPTGDSWSELDTLKSYGSTAKKKKVKAGGDLVSLGNGGFFALKGNKTYEFWRYYLPAGLLARPERSGVMGEPSTIYDSRFAISPNPIASGFATIRYSLPKGGPVTVTVFDVAGRSVFRQSAIGNRSSTMSLDLRGLSNGIYLVRVDAAGSCRSRKLVVQR